MEINKLFMYSTFHYKCRDKLHEKLNSLANTTGRSQETIQLFPSTKIQKVCCEKPKQTEERLATKDGI